MKKLEFCSENLFLLSIVLNSRVRPREGRVMLQDSSPGCSCRPNRPAPGWGRRCWRLPASSSRCLFIFYIYLYLFTNSYV